MVQKVVNVGRIWPPALLVAAIGLLSPWPRPAWAGGFEYGTDNGAEALARGGAVTAYPTLSAIYSNLAAMADVPRADVHLSTNLVFRHLAFQREGFREVADSTPLFPGPMLAAHIRLNSQLVLGLGMHGPAAVGEGHFDHGTAGAPGPTRYLMNDMSFIYGIPTIALAFTLPGIEGLRIGFGFQPAFARAALSIYANALEPDQELFDIRADAVVWDEFVPAIQVGFLYRVTERLEVGAQARLTDSVSAEGDVWPTAFPFDETLRDELPASRARIDVPLPFATVRLGLRYRHPRPGFVEPGRRAPLARPYRSELFDLELDLVYESNSDFDVFVVYPLEPVHLPPPFGDVEVAALPVPQDWRDTVNLRLGSTVHLLGGDLSLSAGVFYQSAAAPLEYTHLVFPAWDSLGLSLGVTYRFRWFEVGVSYAYIYMPDRVISQDQGKIFALRASAGGGIFDEDPPVNAGRFRGGYNILSITLAARLDERRRGEDEEESR